MRWFYLALGIIGAAVVFLVVAEGTQLGLEGTDTGKGAAAIGLSMISSVCLYLSSKSSKGN